MTQADGFELFQKRKGQLKVSQVSTELISHFTDWQVAKSCIDASLRHMASSPVREGNSAAVLIKIPCPYTRNPPLVGGTASVLRASLIAHHAFTQRSSAVAARITLPTGGEFAPCPVIYDVKADGGKSGRRVPEVRQRVAPYASDRASGHAVRRHGPSCSHLASCCGS
ncbi:hypothetical protein NQZ68_013735 [Dissostichus eleginoides]|nr:hypothetical protein NQZ68_013735 [Dissostichus eleginoides]